MDNYLLKTGVFLLTFTFYCIHAQAPEAYFNGSSYVLLKDSLSIKDRLSFSFRTCLPGELLHEQGQTGDSLTFTLLPSGSLELSWSTSSQQGRIVVGYSLNNNKWQNVDLIYAQNTLKLQVGTDIMIIANDTLHPELLAINLTHAVPNLFVGRNFTGCILQGPSILLNTSAEISVNVSWGKCPLPDTENCVGYQVDHCFSQPCQHYGKCISLPDGYYCHCTSRYSGQNCELDDGPLCNRRNYCQNGGRCQEDKTGNDTVCICPPNYSLPYCEPRIQNSLCGHLSCLNGGTCGYNEFNNSIVCTCLPGYGGIQCEQDIDECESSPCRNGGICSQGIDGYSCNCTGTGYKGVNCEININECNEYNPCATGTCFDRYGDYLCHCPNGFGGKNCDQEVGGCILGRCQNGGTCFDRIDGYECSCVQGYYGKNCENLVDNCVGVICDLNAGCINGVNNYTCQCLPGFTGKSTNCTEIDECSSNPCLHGGSCFDQRDSFLCLCPAGYTGIDCGINIDDCATFPCANNGSCFDEINGYRCECLAGFVGEHCEVDIDECAVNPCMNGATCQNLVNDFSCLCLPGWEGKHCDVDTNDCQSAPCQHGQCRDLLNGYECNCSPGYEGANCEINIDDCNPNPCHNGGICEDGVNNFTCMCPPQFMGRICSMTYDACYSAPCHNGATCTTTPPSHEYLCHCPFGFTGNQCETNIDDCAGVVCPPGQICFDMIAAYNCSCPVGYTGADCNEEIDECASSPCQNDAQCVNGLGNFTCLCPPGITGLLCNEDIDECLSSPCEHESVCLNSFGFYRCYCTPGFTGALCHIDINECLSNPCRNNGSCVNVVGNYNCSCTPGFKGRNCEIDINECASNPCRNNGTCKDKINDYECECLPGFSGRDCEINIDECASNPCSNGGRCLDLVNAYSCDCSGTGFTGSNCENIDDCVSSPCLHGSTCIDLDNDFTCDCYPGYTGKRCEMDIPECSSFPCRNGGTCLERSNSTLYELGIFSDVFSFATAGGYYCSCPQGFTGNTCEVDIDDCVQSMCKNGTCVDGINTFTCDCFPGFEGVWCEREIDECERDNPCFGNARCIDKIGDYYCECPPGFDGRNCSIELIGCKSNPCQNNAKCEPFLQNGIHAFRCMCPPGFHGDVCEVSSTFSLNGIPVGPLEPVMPQNIPNMQSHTSADETYSLSFEFRTTISNILLASGYNSDFSRGLIIYMKEGGVYLTIVSQSLKSNSKSMKIGRIGFNNGSWQHITVNLTNQLIVLNASGTNEKLNLAKPLLISYTTLGGFPPNVGDSTLLNMSNFLGCMQSVFVNEDLKVPNVGFMGVVEGCSRADRCYADTCSGHGKCEDMWSYFRCKCERPYFGLTCNSSFTPSTYGYMNSISYSYLRLTSSLQSQVRSDIEISMFIRTREENGLIFHLGSMGPADFTYDIEEDGSVATSFLAALVEDGKLRVVLKPHRGNSSSLSIGKPQNDGNYHFVQVLLNYTHLVLKADLDYKAIPVPFQTIGNLNAEFLYIGGLPPLNPAQLRLKREILSRAFSSLEVYSFSNNIPSFKGIIQDFRINGIQVDCFPVSSEYDDLPEHMVPDNCTKVEEGVKSDDPCSSNPCPASNTCEDIWNDYICVEKRSFCLRSETNPCLNGGTCIDTDGGGYSCQCAPDFEGQDCSRLVIIDCFSNPCMNVASCENVPEATGSQRYKCHCPPFYIGKHCESFRPCKPNPCVHGNCTETDYGYECSCDSPFVGKNCSLEAECLTSSPCTNGGKCVQQLNEENEYQYSCLCQDGYSGRKCEDKVEVLTSENLVLAIGATLGCLCVVAMLIALVMFLRIAKKKRATRGTYSPSRQEMYGSRVEMNHVMKPPPEERLI